MFSPILPTRPARTDSTVPSPRAQAFSASRSAGLRSATMRARSLTKAMKSSFLATKSVSQLTSTSAPLLPSAAICRPISPSAVMRPAALEALLPSLTRSSSSARARSPSASVRAFLHSIMGASVFSRSSLTMAAVIWAMVFSPVQSMRAPTRGARRTRRPPASAGAAEGRKLFLILVLLDLDEFLTFGQFFDQAIEALLTAGQHGVGHATGVQGDGLGGVVVARNDVIDAFGRVVGVDHADHRNTQ